MDPWKAAVDTVQQALKTPRIGTPVFTRIVAHTSEDHGRIEPLLGVALETASSWLGSSIVRLAALGSVTAGQITVQALFARGQTALISAGSRGLSPPLVETLVVGNKGILSWEPDASAAQAVAEVPTLSDEGRRLLGAVRKSLDMGQVVQFDEWGRESFPRGGKVRPDRESPAREKKAPDPFPPTKPPFGLLLIAGNQTHQENYARSFAADPRCRLIAVSDEPGVSPRRRKLNEALAAELKIPHVPNYVEALGRDDVHIVCICAEPERRAGIIVRCAEAGKHLYLDKPLAASAAEVDRITAAVRKAGVISQMFSLVRSPAAERVRQLLATRALGDVAALHVDMMFAKGFPGSAKLEKPREESKQPKSFEAVDSKRELYNVGIYPVVLLNSVLQKPVIRVCGFTGNYFFAEHQRNNMEDFGVALLELEGGVAASISAGRPGWRSHPMGGLNRHYVIGSKGVACLDASRPRLEVWADEAPWQLPRKNPDDPMGFWSSTTRAAGAAPKNAWLTPPVWSGHSVRGNAGHGAGRPRLPVGEKDEFTYFLDCVEQGRASDVSADVAGHSTKVLLAAFESAATGTFVSVS
jgi:predicted dehydrogenase